MQSHFIDPNGLLNEFFVDDDDDDNFIFCSTQGRCEDDASGGAV